MQDYPDSCFQSVMLEKAWRNFSVYGAKAHCGCCWNSIMLEQEQEECFHETASAFQHPGPFPEGSTFSIDFHQVRLNVKSRPVSIHMRLMPTTIKKSKSKLEEDKVIFPMENSHKFTH